MLDAAASRAAKDHGMQLAIDFAGDWRDRALLELRGWLAIHRARGNSTMTMEQFRAEAKNQPDRHQAWGAFASVACKEGLICPMVHGDGSPVYRRAESVKTHAHPVRVYLLASSFSAQATDGIPPSVIEPQGGPGSRQTGEMERVGEHRVSHNAAGLLGAVQAFHREREAG